MLAEHTELGMQGMMEVVITDLPPDGLPVSFREEATALELNVAGARFVQPVTAELLLQKTGQGVYVTGQVGFSVMFECADCLREFLSDVAFEVDAHYFPGGPSAAPGVHPMPTEEAENYYYTGDTVVLDDLIREETLLAIPYRPVCNPGCRGLCAQCGQDLNTGTCQCAPPPDPRLAVLQEYLKKKS